MVASRNCDVAFAAKVDYEKDVKPLLSQNCYSCHGEEVQQSGLRLDLRQNALRGGDYGPVIIPGRSGESKIIRRLVDGDGGIQMPPSGSLTTEEIGVLRAWIDQGAEFRTEIAEAVAKPVDPKLAALAIYALKQYGQALEQASTDHAIAQAVAWLGTATPVMTQDYAFQVLGLAWGGNAEKARSAARLLAARQRTDGGWSQLSTMESDAYATGEVLYALNSAGHIPATDPVYQKGVDYLLRTQAADGSWHVRSRAIWLQPYFESGFPHGQDQFISTAGTAWASMALTLAVQPPTTIQR